MTGPFLALCVVTSGRSWEKRPVWLLRALGEALGRRCPPPCESLLFPQHSEACLGREGLPLFRGGYSATWSTRGCPGAWRSPAAVLGPRPWRRSLTCCAHHLREMQTRPLSQAMRCLREEHVPQSLHCVTSWEPLCLGGGVRRKQPEYFPGPAHCWALAWRGLWARHQ